MAKQTLHTIAAALGISHVTVSLALSGSPRIAKATRERIRDYAASVGYRPNRAAQALKRQTTKTFGYVLPGIASPFNACLADHLYRAALEVGYMLQIVFSGNDLGSERRAIEECIALPVDGLVVSSAFSPAQLPPGETHPILRVAASRFPIIMVGSSWQYCEEAPMTIGFDHRNCFLELTRWLLSQKCQKIYLLLNVSDREYNAAGELQNQGVQQRIAASRHAIEQASLTSPVELEEVMLVHPFERLQVRPGVGALGDPQQQAADERALAAKMLAPIFDEAERSNTPIGLVTMNDQVAAVAQKECLRRGLELGSQVVIAGCDDTLAPWMGFTSYRWDYAHLSRTIIEGLLAQLNGLSPESPEPVRGRVIVRAGVS